MKSDTYAIPATISVSSPLDRPATLEEIRAVMKEASLAVFPERLSDTPTIHGSNVGDPLPLEKGARV